MSVLRYIKPYSTQRGYLTWNNESLPTLLTKPGYIPEYFNRNTHRHKHLFPFTLGTALRSIERLIFPLPNLQY
jgi:hypothetical protein